MSINMTMSESILLGVKDPPVTPPGDGQASHYIPHPHCS